MTGAIAIVLLVLVLACMFRIIDVADDNDRDTRRIVGNLVAVMSLAFVAFAWVAATGCIPPPRTDGAPRDWGQVERTAVRIDKWCLTQDEFMGAEPIGDGFFMRGEAASGVAVDERHVLTNHHVTQCPPWGSLQVKVTTWDGRRFRMVLERDWRDLDVARLVMPSWSKLGTGAPPANIAPVPTLGHMCARTGYPTRQLDCGDVETAYERTQLTDSTGMEYAYDVKFGARTEPGNSGSGVYDEHGNLVGLVTAHDVDDKSHHSYATSLWGTDVLR